MIEDVIGQVIAKAPVLNGDDLIGFVVDAKHYASRHKLFTDVVVNVTDRVDCIMEVSATVAESAVSLQEISAALFDVWRDLYYFHFQAAALSWHTDRTQLRFVTMPDSENYSVTGRIIAIAPHQQALVKNFKEKFDISGRPSAIKE